MRLVVALLLTFFAGPSIALSQSDGANRTYPELWVPLLKKLTKDDVSIMQSSANDYCRSLEYIIVKELYKDVSHCTLKQAAAIMDVDVSLNDLAYDAPTKYRPDQTKRCWEIYCALGARDVENLANCFGDIKYFELLQRSVSAKKSTSDNLTSSYCNKVSQAAGGSYMILEECIKQENASRRRLGR